MNPSLAFTRHSGRRTLAVFGFVFAAVATSAAEPPATVPATLSVPPPAAESSLQFDAIAKEYTAKPGEQSAALRFTVKNISAATVTINQVSTSCGCTVAKLPSSPWPLAPGTSGEIEVTVDLRGKSGVLVKTVTIETPAWSKNLTVKITLPGLAGAADREANQRLTQADRQAVFKGACVVCHAAPTIGQAGAPLYLVACAICHEAEHRAAMVPDLRALNHPTNAEFWRQVIADGKPGTLMPGFASGQGGPLSPSQIDSLVEYLVAMVPPVPAKKPDAGK